MPLRGFAEDEVNEDGYSIRTGKGYEIQGKETRRALGRKSKAANPVVQVVADLTEKTIRFRKNEVGQSLLGLAEKNPTWNAQANQVIDGPVDMARDDRYFGVKRNGKVYYIRIEDKRLLDAMRKVGPQASALPMRVMGSVVRYLSFTNTSASPEFAPTNFARDLQAAGVNLLAEQDKKGGRIEGKNIAGKAVNPKRVASAIAAIYNYHRNKRVVPRSGDELQEYYREFLETGGKTGFFDSPDLDKIAKDLNGKLRSDKSFARSREVGKNVLDFVTDYNNAVENGVRLSTYVEARKEGLSAKRAASLAKNLTVNFNRKGDWGQTISQMYMFFNSAVQGTANMAVSLSPFELNSEGKFKLQKGKATRAQKIAGGMILSGVAIANLNRLVGGEDDDGEAYWDKISPAVRERNLILMKPSGGGEYYKFPLPYGYNFFYNMGDVVEGSLFGSARRKPKLLGQAVSSAVTAFTPLSLHAANSGFEKGVLTLAPTIMVPVAEGLTNTNFFGSDIVREPNPYGAQRAAADNYWASTKAPYIAVAKFLNETVGGGSSYKSSPLDFSPDAMEHVMEYALGGIYRTGTGITDTLNRFFSDREVDAATVPFARRVLGRDSSDFSDRSNYYDIRQEITNARTEYRNSDNKREAVEIHNGLHLLYRSSQQVDKRLARLREQEDRARDSKRLSARERDDKLLELREKMDDEIDRFYVKYRNHLSRRE